MNNLRSSIKKVMLISPQGKVTLTEHGSRERKLAVPPLGLAYLAAQLQKFNFEVNILDVMVEGYEHEETLENTTLYGLPEEKIRDRIRGFNPDLVGVSCLFSNRGKEALRLCQIAKEEIPDAHVILGGQHPSGYPSLALNSHVDYLMYGEAEDSLIELIEAINTKGDLKKVSQLIFVDKGLVWRSPKMRLPDVHSLPLPAWDLVNLEKYWAVGLADYEVKEENEKKFMVMISSRGCPHDCFFCTAPMMTERRYRQRTIPEIIHEISGYVDKYGTREVHFWDDNFFINKKRVKELLKELTKVFPSLTFQVPSGSEINAIDEEVIDLMAQAGFKKLFMAVESPNEEIQEDFVDKKVDLSRIKQLVKKLRQVGIISEGSFMVGFPHETKKQVDATFQKAQEFGFDRISISIVNPLPGTPLYDMCAKENLFYPDFDPQNIRWSAENIKLEEVERGYIGKRRREVWVEYMKDRIDIEKYEKSRGK